MIRKPMDRPRPPVRAADLVARGWSLRELAYLRRVGVLVDADDLQALREPMERIFTAASCEEALAQYRPSPGAMPRTELPPKLLHQRELRDTDRRW